LPLIDKYRDLNNFSNHRDYYKLFCLNKKIGYVHKLVAKDIFLTIKKTSLINKKLYLENTNYDLLSKNSEEIAKILIEKKKLKRLSGEYFPCKENFNHKEIFKLDRSLVEFLGIRGYGVHLIAYTKKNNIYKLWIPKRNKNKLIDPLKLDNTVAGGVQSGEDIYDALKREAKEEAGIPNDIIKKAKLVGTINYMWRNNKFSLRRDTLFVFDLEVDKSFTPSSKDGEVQDFKLIHWKKTLDIIQNTDNFKRNCALVIANFLIRHGLLNIQNDASYEEILRM